MGRYVEMAKDKNSGFRLMGFGHRVYKNFDPRATIIKAMCDRLLTKTKIQGSIFDVAQQLEHAALSDPYFIERKLYPNVDFYSGIIYRAIGIPVQMFTVLFAIGRLPGWIAHWIEMHASPTKKICRPRQIYTGKPLRRLRPARQAAETRLHRAFSRRVPYWAPTLSRNAWYAIAYPTRRASHATTEYRQRQIQALPSSRAARSSLNTFSSVSTPSVFRNTSAAPPSSICPSARHTPRTPGVRRPSARTWRGNRLLAALISQYDGSVAGGPRRLARHSGVSRKR